MPETAEQVEIEQEQMAVEQRLVVSARVNDQDVAIELLEKLFPELRVEKKNRPDEWNARSYDVRIFADDEDSRERLCLLKDLLCSVTGAVFESSLS